jgi:hypothetical protein
MPIYTVTFCTMDRETGSNPFWHTCLLLSRLDDNAKKMQVVDNWGFYGLPSTNNSLRRVKVSIGLDIDLQGNHGMLRHEEMRYLDLGRGLHGVTFELTEDKFKELQKKCDTMAAEQMQAINEIVIPLNYKPKPAEKTRIYPYEDISRHIFGLEKALAKQQNRESRLKPFELSFFETANTCKVQVLTLLQNILTPQQITRLTGALRPVSRYSGKMENIYLHSSGPMRQHVKSSGDIINFRDGTDKDVKLHWTLPPQEIETLSGEVQNLFKVSHNYSEEVKKVIRALQQLEWLFINSKLDAKYEASREKLITHIRDLYEDFSTVSHKVSQTTKGGLSDTIAWLFSQPKDKNEEWLMNYLENARDLFNNFYMAITDNWESENLVTVSDEKAVSDDKKLSPLVSEDLDEDIEALAACLTDDKKKEVCKIIGRQYVEPEHLSLEKLSI